MNCVWYVFGFFFGNAFFISLNKILLTMFTLQQIKDAHYKVKSGADFPKYIQKLILLGVTKYDTFVTDGHGEYYGANNYQTNSNCKYPALSVATSSNTELFIHYLKIHQQGQTDYMTFCKHAAECGVEKWTVAMNAMSCTYYDTDGNMMVEEKIPLV
jgi:uncharacterized protein YbcV (DUF1398 family)